MFFLSFEFHQSATLVPREGDLPKPIGMVIGDRSYEVAYFFNLLSLLRSKKRTSFSWTFLISTSLAG